MTGSDSRPLSTSLATALDNLGLTLLELVWGDPRSAPRPAEIVIHDPYDPPLSPHALVLGIGTRKPDEVAALLRTLGDAAPLLWWSALRSRWTTPSALRPTTPRWCCWP